VFARPLAAGGAAGGRVSAPLGVTAVRVRRITTPRGPARLPRRRARAPGHLDRLMLSTLFRPPARDSRGRSSASGRAVAALDRNLGANPARRRRPGAGDAGAADGGSALGAAGAGLASLTPATRREPARADVHVRSCGHASGALVPVMRAVCCVSPSPHSRGAERFAP
jgi:hypothetical protein